MELDPSNPVIALCVQGMQAEAAEAARELFQRAWEQHRDDFEACVAAHYLAQRQPTPQETLHWNQVAVERAEAAGDDRVRGFHASLYLNLGRSYEDTGSRDEAVRYYWLAEQRTADLPDDGFGNMLRRGIQQALERASTWRF